MVFRPAVLPGADFRLACFAEVLLAVFFAGAAFFATAFLAGAFLAAVFFAATFFAGAFFAGAFFAAAFLATTFFEVPAPVLPEEADFFAVVLEAVFLDPPELADLAPAPFEADLAGADLAAEDLDDVFLAEPAPEDLEALFLAAVAACEDSPSEERPLVSRCSSSSRSTESALTSLLKLLFSPSAVVS